MPSPALKLKISGKGRCNITNAADMKDFISHFGKNGRFLRYAFAEFFHADLLRYFEALGVRFKLERGGRYFPEQDKAAEIADALLRKVRALNIPIATRAEVSGMTKMPGKDFAVRIQTGSTRANKHRASRTLRAGKVILATGGKSYPKTGSTGTGFRLASQLGHTITHLSPSLVPLVTKGDTSKKLKGLSLKNVNVSVWCKGKKMAEQFGEMSFTDFGASGPVVLSLSRTAVPLLEDHRRVSMSIDLKPALTHQKVDRRLLREIEQHSKRNVTYLLKQLLPRQLIPAFMEELHLVEEIPLHQMTAEERKRLRRLLKDFHFEVTGSRPFAEAIITSGGIRIQEIHSHTMESKLVKGLYFGGEMIDVDADTGGFNLQAAFSTGWVAGRSVSSGT